MDEIKKISDTTCTVKAIDKVGVVREESKNKRERRPASDTVTVGMDKEDDKGNQDGAEREKGKVDDTEAGEKMHLNIVI
ncbi:MAG: hypothetical protein GY721_03130 [Deltaproteobacteria bacterium]|nr:hypothetical protein [Deltaproteobacteria bacterium]